MAVEKPDSIAAGHGPSPPMKFSRYRSVRKAAASQKQPQEFQPPATPLPPAKPRSIPSSDTVSSPNGSTNATIQRSMSRYRRQRTPPSRSSSEVVSQPPVPVPTDQVLAYRTQADGATNGYPVPSEIRDPDKAKNRNGVVPITNPFLDDEEVDEDAERERHRQNAMDRLTGGDRVKRRAPSRPRTRERSVKHREGPSRHGDERPRRSLTEMIKPSSRSKDKPKPDAPEKGADQSMGARFPGLDAPVSAVNAGERRVVVQYKKTSMDLPVTPSTSVQDLLFLAADSLTSEIDPTKFILMESFLELGLERPLRRYESVRDIMNSWAHDRENTLIVVPPASLDALVLLDSQRVPAQPPADVVLHLYYSQRPRKWDKRYITIRSDGQITVSKREQGQDQANVCHLSDFDIYSPTASFLSHNVKPPKKICHAVKSQQKSSMFLSTENFVHFFATNDRTVADQFSRAVQTWRSWYLVNRLGAGHPEEKADTPEQPSRPLLNMSASENHSDEGAPSLGRSKSSRSKDLFSRKKSTREHGPPPPAFPKSFADASETADAPADDSPFASSSLLGRTYTLRQRAMKEREEREKRANEEPFTAQGLVGSMSPRRSRPASRSNTMTSTNPPDLHGLMKRSQSEKIKPLVDLTPVYQEPPQHTRKGRGVAVEPGQPLIDAATGPEVPGGISIPPATTWRRPPPPVIPSLDTKTRQRSNTARSTSNPRHRPHNHQSATAPTSPITPADPSQPREDPFLPNSLLARSAHTPGQGIMAKGHGVATGDRNASKPMLDMSPENPFAEGSLLRGL
ncbi:hypothetical protein BDV59DRAFT_175049 [Aspergillus ambiguus]|uniref:uncharacterized protein n=1 Tax=Aspergillus ambiguus TaxID=176160 RepID=UPI003CCE00F0